MMTRGVTLSVSGQKAEGVKGIFHMKLIALIVIMPSLGFLGPIPARGQDCGHHDYHYGDCWDCDHGRPGSRTYYQESSETPRKTLEGKIAEVVYLPGATPDSGMVEIRVLSAGRTTLIRLAPTGFLKKGGLSLVEGDVVTTTGFAVSSMEGDLLVATEVRKGERSLALRDARGRPIW